MRMLFFILAFFLSAAHGQEFLDPQVAFQPRARIVDGRTVEIHYTIADGYYLYRDKFRVQATEPAGARLGSPDLPPGQRKRDEHFGEVEVFYRNAVLRIPLASGGTGTPVMAVDVVAQGCADAGLCYPPHTQTVRLDAGATDAAPPASAPAPTPVALDETGRIADTLRRAGLWTLLGFFFVAGLGLSLTPCVFPMVPILSGIIAGQGHQARKGRSVVLSLAYVLGMSLTYAAAGVAAGLTGTLLSATLQNAWVLGGFALVFVALAMSMFGFYELQLPASLQSRLSSGSGRLQGGQTLGVFLMGALSALIVGPCVAAPLAGALLYIGQTGDALLGGLALFTMALGMGVPLLAVGIAGGSLLPRAGAWMDGVKKTFGVLLLATAWWLLSPLLPSALPMLGWAVLLIIPAMYLHAIDPLPAQASGWMRFWKGVGLVMLLCGAGVLLGALAGQRDVLQPLAGWAARGAPASPETAGLRFETVRSVAELQARVAAADRPVLLDVSADWCVACKEMEQYTFTDPGVRARMQTLVLLKADVTANGPEDQSLLAHFGLYGPPGILFFDPAKGQEHTGLRVVGFQKAEKFLATLERLRL